MGVAACSGNFMDIYLAPLVWKMLVQEKLGEADIDILEAKLIRDMRNADSPETFTDSFGDLNFAVSSSGGSVVDLHPGGAQELITWDMKERYIEELLRYRLVTEMKPAVTAVRRGLHSQISENVIRMMPAENLEQRVCGSRRINFELLKSMTTYTGYLPSDNVIKWFWEIMVELSPEEQKGFIKFISGGTRLPKSRKAYMNITRMEKPDQYLPVAHTCFFQIELPK